MQEYADYFLGCLQAKKDAAKSVKNLG